MTTLDDATITLSASDGSRATLTPANAATLAPGLARWRDVLTATGRRLWAELRYGEIAVSGPYTSGPYLPGVLTQLHVHTTESDGALSPAAVVAQYAAAGYGALALTDHDLVTAQPAGLALPIVGNEASFGSHILALGAAYQRGGQTDPQMVIDGIAAAGGLAVIAHPALVFADTTLAQLHALDGYAGIEIHNAVALGHPDDREHGFAIEWWDDLLRTGRRVWAFASDDFHETTGQRGYDIGRLVVWPTAATPAGLLAAIQRGDFAADVSNHGVTLAPPTVAPDAITLDCPGATRIRWLTEAGLAQTSVGGQSTYEPSGAELYVRAEVIGGLAESFAAPLAADRWGVRGGTWATVADVLEQQADSDQEYQILLKRHLPGDVDVTVDLLLPANGQQEQAGVLLNALDHDNLYYACLRGASASVPNTLTLWHRSGGDWGAPLVSVPFAPEAARWYRLRAVYEAATATYRVRCWRWGQPEPSGWQIERVQAGWQGGMVGLRSRRRAWFDSLTIDGFTSYYQPLPVRAWQG